VPGFIWNFDWDIDKASANWAKHGITFKHASTVLFDSLAITTFDDEHSEREQRWVTLGLSARGPLLVVVHTLEETGPGSADVRIISARRATPFEM
jgi:uncharacterized DUF497 family protein